MLGNENVHLYNSGDSDGGQIIRRRSTTRDSLPAVYLRNRNEICESMGPYASSRSLVNGRKAVGSAYVDHQGFYLDESKDMRDCEDPSLGRFRRVRDASHPESIIVLMDELPTVSHREVWSPASPYCLASPVASPDANQTKEFDSEQKLSHKGSFVNRSFAYSLVEIPLTSLVRFISVPEIARTPTGPYSSESTNKHCRALPSTCINPPYRNSNRSGREQRPDPLARESNIAWSEHVSYSYRG